MTKASLFSRDLQTLPAPDSCSQDPFLLGPWNPKGPQGHLSQVPRCMSFLHPLSTLPQNAAPGENVLKGSLDYFCLSSDTNLLPKLLLAGLCRQHLYIPKFPNNYSESCVCLAPVWRRKKNKKGTFVKLRLEIQTKEAQRLSLRRGERETDPRGHDGEGR